MDEILEEQRRSIRNSLRVAEAEHQMEDRLYALFTNILESVSTFVSPKDQRSSWTIHPQPTLIPDTHLQLDTKTKECLQITPDIDFSLLTYITATEILQWLALLLEAKRLPKRNSDKSSSPWCNVGAARLAHEGQFKDSIQQLFMQGFAALHAFPKQDSIHVVFLVGPWFTLLRFKRWPDLAAVPEKFDVLEQSHPLLTDAQIRQHAIFQLMPRAACPEVLFYAEPLFEPALNGEQLTFADPLILSAPFCDALSIMLLGNCGEMILRPCSLFGQKLGFKRELEDSDAAKQRCALCIELLEDWYKEAETVDNTLKSAFSTNNSEPSANSLTTNESIMSEPSTPTNNRSTSKLPKILPMQPDSFYESPVKHERTGEVLEQGPESPPWEASDTDRSPPTRSLGSYYTSLRKGHSRLKRAKRTRTEFAEEDLAAGAPNQKNQR